MSQPVNREAPETHSPCCNAHKAKVGVYATAVTFVAIAVILGALVLVNQYYQLNLGPFNGPMSQTTQFLGQYTYVPVAASGGLLLTLIVGGIIWKCSGPAPQRQPHPWTQGSSTTLQIPYPVRSLADPLHS